MFLAWVSFRQVSSIIVQQQLPLQNLFFSFFLLLNFKGALYLAGDETREPVRRKVGRLMLMTTVEQLVRAQGGDAP